MSHVQLKMVMIVYYEAMDDEVMEVVEHCGVPCHTKLEGALGKGKLSGTRLGNDVWPGKNNIIYIACEDEVAGKIINCVAELREKRGKEGIKAFIWSLENMT